MRQLTLDRGAELVIVSIPQLGLSKPERAYPDLRLARWSEQHDTLFVPTLPALRDAGPEQTLYWVKDGHCTSAGHAIIARSERLLR